MHVTAGQDGLYVRQINLQDNSVQKTGIETFKKKLK